MKTTAKNDIEDEELARLEEQFLRSSSDQSAIKVVRSTDGRSLNYPTGERFELPLDNDEEETGLEKPDISIIGEIVERDSVAATPVVFEQPTSGFPAPRKVIKSRFKSCQGPATGEATRNAFKRADRSRKQGKT